MTSEYKKINSCTIQRYSEGTCCSSYWISTVEKEALQNELSHLASRAKALPCFVPRPPILQLTEFVYDNDDECKKAHVEKYESSETHLYEEPGCHESETAVLSIETIVIRVEAEVVQVEEPRTQNNKQTVHSLFLPLIFSFFLSFFCICIVSVT